MHRQLYTLITGASEGLGKSMAIECAARKMNLVLVALPGAALFNLADFLRKNFQVSVHAFEKDLSLQNDCEQLYYDICEAGLSVNMLINNAGIGGTQLFKETNIGLFEKQIKVNVLATTLITKLFMEDLQKNRPSHILNVSSLGCFFFLPKKQVYIGTKSFIYSFTKSLRTELQREGISVSVVCPGGMNSNPTLAVQNRSGNFISRMSVMNPEDVAQVSIDSLLKGKEVIIPGRLNQLFLFIDKVLPSFLKRRIVQYQMNTIPLNHPVTTNFNYTIAEEDKSAQKVFAA
jgi:short-subunit dehydrogenase